MIPGSQWEKIPPTHHLRCIPGQNRTNSRAATGKKSHWFAEKIPLAKSKSDELETRRTRRNLKILACAFVDSSPGDRVQRGLSSAVG